MYISPGIFAFKTLCHITILFPDINFLLPDKTKRLNFPKEKKKSHPLNIPRSSRAGCVLSQSCSFCWEISSVENCAVTRH